MSDSPSSLLFPPPLPEGGTIGVVSPGKWAKPESIDAMARKLKACGFDVVVHDQNFLRQGQLAGSEAARAEAMADMFGDRTIDAVFCARGGAGSILILDRLDYELIRKNPKPFVGFSDVTALHLAITRRTGLVTYHGPMDWNFQPKIFDQRTLDDLLTVIGGTADAEARRTLSFPQARVAREGAATGRLVGGNMCLLQALIGTPFDWSGDGALLFIEEVDEPLYKIERMLAHMRLAGKFDGLNAVLVGDMVDLTDDVEPPEVPYGKTLEEIVLAQIPPEIPVAFNVPCGHAPYITTLPVGAEARALLSKDGGVLTFGP